MKILIILGLAITTTYGDIGLKLRQQQQQFLQQNGGVNFGGEAKNNPFFIPKIDAGNLGNIGSAATNIEQRATSDTKTERTHTLEELCNDAFHSFLCKPVSGKRRRIDGNLRPGAVLPPGILRPESSNTKENKLLPPQQPASNNSPNRLNPSYIKQPSDSQVPAAQSEQGYFYPKPSNTFEFNKPLKNGYLPPDNGFRATSRPTIQTTRYTPPTTRPPLTTRPQLTARPPQTTRPPFTYPTTTQRPRIPQPSSTIRPVQNNFDSKFQTTPRPIITTRILTTRPTIRPSIFTQPQATYTQPVKYDTSKTPALNSYLPPVTGTQRSPTTRAPFFTRPTPRTTVSTTRPPLQTRPPQPPSTQTPYRPSTTTFRPSTYPPIKFSTPVTKSQTIANTYLPPYAEQRFNPVVVSTTTTTPRPTFKPFPTLSNLPKNTYLPPDNPPIDVRFGSASNTRKESAVLPDAAQNPSVTVKPDEEHNLERLCNDPFHSFLCQPITKTRYRFDGRLRPQASIPEGILVPSNSFDSPVKALPELQSSTNIQASSVPSDSGYMYPNPNSAQSNSQPFLGLVLSMPSSTALLQAANENSVANTGYFYPAPSNNGITASQSTSLSPTQIGYDYPKPSNNNQFNIISSSFKTETPTVNKQVSTVSTTPKTLLTNNQFYQPNNLLSIQNTNREPFTIATERTLSLQTGYDYPKPSFNQQFPFPSQGPSSLPVTAKTESQFIYTTSSPRPTTVYDTTYKYQPTGSQKTSFTGFENSNPTNTRGVTISTTERPTTLLYQYKNPTSNLVSPSPQTFFNYQKPANDPFPTFSTQQAPSTGYSYPKPENPLQEQPSNNVAQGYFYPKPSVPFSDNSLNSFGSSQFLKNSQNPFSSSFSKSISFSSNQAALLAQSIAQQQSVNQEADPKTAKNINQLLGPSNESNNRDLPPSNQFEILKVKKRQNG